MNYILSIDTSTPACSVAVHESGELIGSQSYRLGKSHSSLLPVIIDQLLKNIQIQTCDLKAIAICSGPGSYTGLRIGASIAKGLCYTLEIPLIAISSLQLISDQVLRQYPNDLSVVITSIDARRNEVYTHVVNSKGEILLSPEAMVLDEDSYAGFKKENTIYIAGDGATKTKELVASHDQVFFLPQIMPEADQLGVSAFKEYLSNNFQDVAYYEPYYLKEFYTTQQVKK